MGPPEASPGQPATAQVVAATGSAQSVPQTAPQAATSPQAPRPKPHGAPAGTIKRPVGPGGPRPQGQRPARPKPPPPPPPPPTALEQVTKHLLHGPGLIGLCTAGAGLVLWQVVRLVRRQRSTPAGGKVAPAPCANVKPSAQCVPLADGSACVVRRKIAADNSCLFNAVAYCMHGSKQKAAFLRNVVAREVSSDPETYSAAFLGMNNMAYCNWIVNPVNWGGGIELAILSRHYGREIGAWCIETGKQHVFGEDAGHPKAVMLIYTGTHYDALAIAKHPRAPESEDKTEFNPRTKSGKMALAAAQKLVLLSRGGKGKQAAAGLATGKVAAGKAAAGKPAKPAAAAAVKLRCEECQEVCDGQAGAAKHAGATGHTRFAQLAA